MKVPVRHFPLEQAPLQNAPYQTRTRPGFDMIGDRVLPL